MIFLFKRDGYLETMGPAGANSMNQLYVRVFLAIFVSLLTTFHYTQHSEYGRRPRQHGTCG